MSMGGIEIDFAMLTICSMLFAVFVGYYYVL
jgi:hypothetical protein